jgi:hypothetical protein
MLIREAWPYYSRTSTGTPSVKPPPAPKGGKADSGKGSAEADPMRDSLLTSETGDLFNFSSNYLPSQFVQSA